MGRNVEAAKVICRRPKRSNHIVQIVPGMKKYWFRVDKDSLIIPDDFFCYVYIFRETGYLWLLATRTRQLCKIEGGRPVPVVYNRSFIEKSDCSQTFLENTVELFSRLHLKESRTFLPKQLALIAVLKRPKSIILRPPFDLHEIMVDFFIFGGLPFQIKLKVILSTSFENSGGQGSTELTKTSFESANDLTICIFPSSERSLVLHMFSNCIIESSFLVTVFYICNVRFVGEVDAKSVYCLLGLPKI